jgi:hypothetical protein
MTTVFELKAKGTSSTQKQPISTLSPGKTSTNPSDTIGIAPTRLLLSVKPIRQSLRNWSGCEDVMKVALQLAKQACRAKACSIPYVTVQPPQFDAIPGGKYTSWGGVFRFKLMVYVPGLVWTARESVDFVRTEQEFDMPYLYRDIFKLIHLCADYQGDLLVHSVSELEQRQLSDTLVGPVHLFGNTKLPQTMTLGKLLVLLHDADSAGSSSPKSYTLEQAILLPTIQLAVMYEATHAHADSVINTYQSQHIDKLQLSGGGKWLHVLDNFLEREKVWEQFMSPRNVNEQTPPVGRDTTNGLYQGGIGNNQETQWLHGDRVGVSYEKNVVEFR